MFFDSFAKRTPGANQVARRTKGAAPRTDGDGDEDDNEEDEDNGAYLRVLEAELLGQLLALRLRDVLLDLEAALEAATLQLGEHRPAHHPCNIKIFSLSFVSTMSLLKLRESNS